MPETSIPPSRPGPGPSHAAAVAPANAKEPSHEWFEGLYATARDDLYAYVASIVRNRSTAEEVVATAFERAWRRRERFDPSRGSSRGWLFAIARNAALDELRRSRRELPLTREPAAPAADRDLSADVRRAVNELEPRDRELVVLRYVAGLRLAEIATALGISETAAGSRVHRAIKRLRRNLDG